MSVSSSHDDKLSEAIRLKLPKHYPQEDVKALCDFYNKAASGMLDNLATVSITGFFPFDILSKHREVKQCLDSHAGLPVAEVKKPLLKQKLN